MRAVGAHVVSELYFLESLRGRPGIPTLHGGWLEDDALSYVVADGGSEVTRYPHAHRNGKPGEARPSDAWRDFARKDPMRAARALLECFRSFVDYGGFFLSDFSPHQFTLRGASLFVVDGPDALDGLMSTFFFDRGLSGQLERRVQRRGNPHALSPNLDDGCDATRCEDLVRFLDPPSLCCCSSPGGGCADANTKDACLLDRARCALVASRPHAADVQRTAPSSFLYLLPSDRPNPSI